MTKPTQPRGWSTVPLTPERWEDLAALFGERGACGGCWCMAWRLPSREFRAGKGSKNRRALKKLADAGEAPGILGYLGSEPVAWCAVAPRADYSFLTRSRVLAPVDGCEVWSVTCLFIRKEHRRRGLSARMLRSAAAFAAQRGARVVEGYPTVPYSASAPAAFLWTGTEAAFRKAGYREVARRSRSRPMMRRAVRPEA
jgi:GNAT superfamily N-acetyltransferase